MNPVLATALVAAVVLVACRWLERRRLNAVRDRISNDDLLGFLAHALRSNHIIAVEAPRPRCSCGWVADWSPEWGVMVDAVLEHRDDVQRQAVES